jgi:putative Mn2+ efflux pump MntP
MSVLLIGLTTGLFSMAGVRIGNVFGLRFKSTAELLGGLILIIMGVKILVDHTLLQ